MPAKPRHIPFQLHPRVFAALGSDLVTNDLVAITELVKNSYDAFAERVDVRFGNDETGDYIEVCDDGMGMSADIIETVWCVVATPFRAEQPHATRGRKTRRVAGEKGLGRLSAARLGGRLEMLTQAKKEPCYRIDVSWSDISAAADLSECRIQMRECDGDSPFHPTGTRLRISQLHSDWTEDRLDELHEHLSRLVSPFSAVNDFEIWLQRPGESQSPVRVESPDFLQHPKYTLTASFSESGELRCRYGYAPVDSGESGRSRSFSLSWNEVRDRSRVKSLKTLDRPNCGPFELELRVWDIAPDDLGELVDRFRLKKAEIRSAIRAHKGISVYRDGILVLPKSESARDWLGLDIRRVSDVGPRLSTSQMIGYVSISATDNPRIKDTSDRERLVDSPEVEVFEATIRAAVGALEQERQKDRVDGKSAERKMSSLFQGMSVDSLREKLSDVSAADDSTANVLKVVTEFGIELDKDRKELERRFVYYSRLATVGTLAQMLVHEVGNKTTVVGAFLRAVAASPQADDFSAKLRKSMELATSAISGLDRLAETFLPLASRSFARSRRTSFLEEHIRNVLAMLEPRIRQHGISVRFEPRGTTHVAVDPGELEAGVLNLADNAVYWLSQVPKDSRHLDIRISRLRNGERVKVSVHDSGPGVPDEDAERVFYPGVTSKPNGIGMGLTIAGEIVAAYDGELRLCRGPTELGGATFEFDLPIRTK